MNQASTLKETPIAALSGINDDKLICLKLYSVASDRSLGTIQSKCRVYRTQLAS